MISKSLACLLLGVAAGTAALAKQTPAPPQPDNAPRALPGRLTVTAATLACKLKRSLKTILVNSGFATYAA